MADRGVSLPALAPARPGGADDTLPAAVIQRAAEWMARLWSDEATAADQAACARWRSEHPHHELAWNRLQAFESRLHGIPREVARYALREPAAKAWRERRRILQWLGLLATAGGTAYLTCGPRGREPGSAHHDTGTGEIREVRLPDGSQVVLASATHLEWREDAGERLLTLLKGEILVTTAPDPAPGRRPFRVRDRHGTVQALGTRFTVRLHDDHTFVAVFDGAVLVQPAAGDGQPSHLASGQSARYTRQVVQPPAAATQGAEAWARGLLVADDMPLAVFVAELARYRSGILRCDPAVAPWKVTGIFSLHDTDRALQNLMLGLPVTVVWRSRWWGTVRALRA